MAHGQVAGGGVPTGEWTVAGDGRLRRMAATTLADPAGLRVVASGLRFQRRPLATTRRPAGSASVVAAIRRSLPSPATVHSPVGTPPPATWPWAMRTFAPGVLRRRPARPSAGDPPR